MKSVTSINKDALHLGSLPKFFPVVPESFGAETPLPEAFQADL
jgi:hypothetical protein